jgi:hypothetical protein
MDQYISLVTTQKELEQTAKGDQFPAENKVLLFQGFLARIPPLHKQ